MAELQVVVSEMTTTAQCHMAEVEKSRKALLETNELLSRGDLEILKLKNEVEAAKERESKVKEAFAKVARRADGLQSEVDGYEGIEKGLKREAEELNKEISRGRSRLEESQAEFRKMAEVVGEKTAQGDGGSLSEFYF